MVTNTPVIARRSWVKLDLLVNGEPVDAFSTIVHRDRAEETRCQLARETQGVIPRQLYQIWQPSVERFAESVSALRKNVTAKCYGGDITKNAVAREAKRDRNA
jgi:GTP-binding protein LepA